MTSLPLTKFQAVKCSLEVAGNSKLSVIELTSIFCKLMQSSLLHVKFGSEDIA